MVWYSLADTKETQNSANLVLLVMDPLWQDLVELLLEPPEEKMELWDIAEWKDSCSRGNEDEPDWRENVTWLKSRGFCSWKLVICKNVIIFLHLKEIQANETNQYWCSEKIAGQRGCNNNDPAAPAADYRTGEEKKYGVN